jgi:stearoyl-CoA desaturase (delta-9 desaturase)
MNWYYYRVFLPLTVLWLFSACLIYLDIVSVEYMPILLMWFLIGPIGIGVGFHRLFSHRQFETYRPVELTIAYLGTISGYAPLLFWVANHQYHHRHSDDINDLSSPKKYGFIQSFLLSRLKSENLEKVDLKNYCVRRLLMDRNLRFLSRHFEKIFWLHLLVCFLFGANFLVNYFLIPVFLEHLRINAVSSLSHLKIPFSYQNHQTSDFSHNNLFLGYLTCGFAWHNNHHFNERKLNLHEKWWEFDLEGVLARLISKRIKDK